MIQPIGYIKLYRELASKPIWENSTPEQKVILITLLMMANFKEKQWEWKGEKFKANSGQFITSLENIAQECGKGVSVQNVRTALTRFEKLDFLTNESTKTGRLITIVNWELYQSDDENQQSISQRPNKDLTTREERKKEINKTLYDFVFEYYLSVGLIKHKSLTADMKKAIDKSKKELGLDFEYFKRIIDRHKEKVEQTKNDQYPVKPRSLSELFGQKKYNSVSLICTDYLDEFYEKPKNKKEKSQYVGGLMVYDE